MAFTLETGLSKYLFMAPNGVKSHCQVNIWKNGDLALVEFMELDDNPGMSVTNASEHLATIIAATYKLNPTKTRFFERYPGESPAMVDEIKYTWKDKKTAHSPQWVFFGRRDTLLDFIQTYHD